MIVSSPGQADLDLNNSAPIAQSGVLVTMVHRYTSKKTLLTEPNLTSTKFLKQISVGDPGTFVAFYREP